MKPWMRYRCQDEPRRPASTGYCAGAFGHTWRTGRIRLSVHPGRWIDYGIPERTGNLRDGSSLTRRHGREVCRHDDPEARKTSALMASEIWIAPRGGWSITVLIDELTSSRSSEGDGSRRPATTSDHPGRLTERVALTVTSNRLQTNLQTGRDHQIVPDCAKAAGCAQLASAKARSERH